METPKAEWLEKFYRIVREMNNAPIEKKEEYLQKLKKLSGLDTTPKLSDEYTADEAGYKKAIAKLGRELFDGYRTYQCSIWKGDVIVEFKHSETYNIRMSASLEEVEKTLDAKFGGVYNGSERTYLVFIKKH
jgi:hypothetical protein